MMRMMIQIMMTFCHRHIDNSDDDDDNNDYDDSDDVDDE